MPIARLCRASEVAVRTWVIGYRGLSSHRTGS